MATITAPMRIVRSLRQDFQIGTVQLMTRSRWDAHSVVIFFTQANPYGVIEYQHPAILGGLYLQGHQKTTILGRDETI
jgi:hypothetical protein